MRIKRAIAVLLTTAMIMTSQSLTSVVMAAETTDASAANQEVLTKISSETVDETSVPASEAVTEEVQKGTSKEAALGQSSIEADENASAEETAENVSAGETAEEAEEVQMSEAEPADSGDEAVIDEAVIDDAASEDDIELCAAEDYFETDSAKCYTEAGRILLTKKDGGASISGTVTIPKCVQVIPKDTDLFYGNTAITEVKFESGSSLEEIAPNAFEDSTLQTIELPAGVKTIGKEAFKNSQLSDLSFLDSKKITTICEGTFEGTKITSVNFDKVTEVESSAFKDCKQLSNVSMNSVKTIGKNAFAGCTSLDGGMSFSSTIEEIGNNAFKNCGFQTLNLSNLTNLVSNSGIENGCKLGTGVFADNEKLTTASFPVSENFIEIPNSTFSGCKKLKNVPISKYIEKICGNAFKNCSSLVDIDLAAKVGVVESGAYEGCSGLKTITIQYKDVDDDFVEQSHVTIAYDAFPNKSGVTMKGFDSEVQAYAERMGYKFESLYPQRTITLKETSSKVSISKKSALPGEEITFSVTSATNAALKNVSYYWSGGTMLQAEYVGSQSATVHSFKLLMPNENITIVAESEVISGQKLSYDFVGGVGERPGKINTNSYSWETRGKYAQLKLLFDNQPFGNWAFDFKSSNPKVIAVNSTGIVSAVEKGTATITASLKTNKSKTVSINFSVAPDGEDLQIGKMYVGGELINVGKRGTISVDPVTNYPVVTFDKATLAVGEQTVEIKVKAYAWENVDDHGKGVIETDNMVSSSWGSTDVSIASVLSPTSSTNSNKITVKKGSSGETQINISTLNYGEKVPNERNSKGDNEDNIAHVIIRVVDTTPRLGDSSIILNNQLVQGALVSIVPVYGREISDDDDLIVCTKEVTKDNVVNYVPCSDFSKVVYVPASNKWSITTSDSLSTSLGLANKKLTYKNKLYLCGKYKSDGNLVKGSFQIPVPLLTVTNEQLKPRITQRGAINLFYNRKADYCEKGYVVVTESLKTNPVVSYELVSVDNYKGDTARINAGGFDAATHLQDRYETDSNYKNSMVKNNKSIRYDSLSYNFDIDVNTDLGDTNNYQALITRSDSFDDIAKKNNRNVVSGYLYIYFAGYKYPAMVPITVSNVNTAPSYKLSQTAVTAYAEETGQKYDLFLYPSTMVNDKKNAVKLNDTYEEKDGVVTKWYIGFNTVSNTSNFRIKETDEGEDGLRSKTLLDDNIIRLQVPANQTAVKSRCVISLHKTTWSDPDKCLFYTFTVNTIGKLTAKLDSTTKVINAAYVGGNDEQDIVVSVSSDDAEITGLEDREKNRIITYISTAKTADAYQILFDNTTIEAYDKDKDGKNEAAIIKIKQPRTQEDADKLINGRYVFTLNAQAKLKNNAKFGTEDLTPVKYTITVSKAAPTIVLGRAFSLNALSTVTSENVTVSCKIGYLMAGTTQGGNDNQDPYRIDDTDATYKSKTKTYSKRDFTNLVADINYNAASISASARRGENYKNNTGIYTVSNVYVVSPGGARALAKNFNVSLAATKTVPTVTLTRKGSINMIVPSSAYTYTATVKNVAGKITDVKIVDVSPYSGATSDSRFKVEMVADNQFKISVNDEYVTLSDKEDKNLVSPYENIDKSIEQWKVDGHYRMVPKTPYFFKLYFNISSMENGSKGEGKVGDIENGEYDVASATLSINPSQVFPTATRSIGRGYAYAGQDREVNKWDIVIYAQVPEIYRKSSDPGKVRTPVEITGFEWDAKTSQAIKDEFNILDNTFAYNPITGIAQVSIRLRNASEQMQNKNYQLPLVLKFNHQAKDTYGTKVTYTVNIRK